MIDVRHPLAVLASRVPWQEIEAQVAQVFSRKARTGAALPDLDLFGEQVQRAARASHAGRPRVPLRIMISLLYLKHVFNESDARQFKRMRRAIKRQRTIVGRLVREIGRKASALGHAVRQALQETLDKAARIATQSRQRKPVEGQPKLYAWHAPAVSCISKGKARQPYEFGVKVGIASTLRGNLIVGARAFAGNPYDGHTLSEQLEQCRILMQDCQARPTRVVVDLGYRGVDADNPDVRIVHRGKSKRLSAQERQQLKRRQAIEPIIGHLKADHRMNRCPLKGEQGDSVHAVLCAAGYYNLRWLLRMIARKGIAFLWAIFLWLHAVCTLASVAQRRVVRTTLDGLERASSGWLRVMGCERWQILGRGRGA
ncbi:transposase [Diaphorobacter aerolatus]|uniref:transposase n=1 Tax=Diaphorobacter aerolatus TaxID=1288495 RepID=UPI001D02BC38